jgi:hypothetical protein
MCCLTWLDLTSDFCSALKLLYGNHFHKQVLPFYCQIFASDEWTTPRIGDEYCHKCCVDLFAVCAQFPSTIGSEDKIGAEPKIQFELFGKFWKT